MIQLQGAGLNEWLNDVEQKLTLAVDLLDVIEEEAEQFKGIWESSAGEIWKSELQLRISEVRSKFADMKQILLNIGEMSRALSDLENSMITDAKKL